MAKHDYNSVLSYLPRCRLLRDGQILKTRTRGREENERGLRKERNKWDGGGGDRAEKEKERERELEESVERRSKLKSEQGGS